METIKRILITILIIGFYNVCWGQSVKVDTPQVIPAFPTINDSVKIVVKVETNDQGKIIFESIGVHGNYITIYYCISASVMPSPSIFVDTFTIRQLAVGTYTVLVAAYKSSDFEFCIPIDSHKVSKTFDVTYTNSLPSIELAGYKIKLSPNPATNYQNLTISLEKTAELEITLHDISGRLVKTIHKGNSPAGEATFEADLSFLPSGIYFYRKKNNDTVHYHKAIKL